MNDSHTILYRIVPYHRFLWFVLNSLFNRKFFFLLGTWSHLRCAQGLVLALLLIFISLWECNDCSLSSFFIAYIWKKSGLFGSSKFLFKNLTKHSYLNYWTLTVVFALCTMFTNVIQIIFQYLWWFWDLHFFHVHIDKSINNRLLYRVVINT